MVCLADETEQLVTLERWAGHEVRSWVAVSDVIVGGPLDPRLLPVAIFSTRVIGLGVCASRDQAATAEPIDGGTGQSRGPGARLLDVHSIVQTPTGPRAIDLGSPMQLTRQLSGSDPAVLYSPPVVGPGESLGPSGPDPSRGLPTEAGAAYGTPEPMLPLRTADPVPWPIGSYSIAFRFDSDVPGVVHWLRFDIIKGAGGLG
jgi:hypothetical protein